MAFVEQGEVMEVRIGDRAQVKNVSMKLLDSEKEEVQEYMWFEKNYLKARKAGARGAIKFMWSAMNNDWYFISHQHGTGVYKDDEFVILPEEE